MRVVKLGLGRRGVMEEGSLTYSSRKARSPPGSLMLTLIPGNYRGRTAVAIRIAARPAPRLPGAISLRP
jgi:hypothetical protein